MVIMPVSWLSQTAQAYLPRDGAAHCGLSLSMWPQANLIRQWPQEEGTHRGPLPSGETQCFLVMAILGYGYSDTFPRVEQSSGDRAGSEKTK